MGSWSRSFRVVMGTGIRFCVFSLEPCSQHAMSGGLVVGFVLFEPRKRKKLGMR